MHQHYLDQEKPLYSSLERSPGMRTKTPKFLYHTTLTVIDYHENTGGSTESFYILGTYSKLAAANAFAKTALQSQGFPANDFAVYQERQPGQTWPHGDDCTVYAEAPAGQMFLVSIVTKTNDEELHEGPEGSVVIPEGENNLHYVVQTEINYSQPHDSRYYTHDIKGCYARRAKAFDAAIDCLRGKKNEFGQYYERKNLDDMPEVSTIRGLAPLIYHHAINSNHLCAVAVWRGRACPCCITDG